MEGVREIIVRKQKEVDLVRDHFTRAVSAVLVDFRGVDVERITDLRARFREQGIEYRVVKNTLIRRALEGAKVASSPNLAQQLKGPTAIAWSFEDPSAAAKVIKAFRKEGPAHEKLTVKGGLLEGEFLGAERVEAELATLPSKNELRSMLLAQMLAPAQSLVRQLLAPLQNLVYALDARVRQQQGND